jgi:hypothetical protein
VQEGSTLLFSPNAPDTAGAITVPLIGSFRLIRLNPDPNVRIGYDITSLRLCGGTQFTFEGITGDYIGSIGIFGEPGAIISASFWTRINGSPSTTLMGGRGPFHSTDDGEIVLEGIELCSEPHLCPVGAGSRSQWRLTLFAAPAA